MQRNTIFLCLLGGSLIGIGFYFSISWGVNYRKRRRIGYCLKKSRELCDNGNEEDMLCGMKLLREARSLKSIEASYRLGLCYKFRENREEVALKLFQEALESGHHESAYQLYLLYRSNRYSITQNDTLAEKYLEEAILLGNVEAMVQKAKNILRCYVSDRPNTISIAIELLENAVDSNNSEVNIN